MSTRYIEQLIATAKFARKEIMRDMEPRAEIKEGFDRYRIELTVGNEMVVQNDKELQRAKEHAARIFAEYIYGDLRSRVIKALGHVIAHDRDAAIEALESIQKDLS